MLASPFVLNAEIPVYFMQQWNSDGECPPSGWTSVGSGKRPAGSAAALIGYNDAWQSVTLPDGETYMASASTTEEGGRVKTELFTPAISLPAEGAILSVDLVNYNPDKSVNNKVSVYAVSKKSQESYDENEPLFSERITANNYLTPLHIAVPVENIGGNDVVIVFVNEGNDAGLLGIGTIKISMYDARIRNLTPVFVTDNSEIPTEVYLDIASRAESVTATISTEGKEESVTIATPPMKGYASYRLPFKTRLNVKDENTSLYTIKISPDLKGYEDLVTVGSIAKGEGFASIVVEEEGTGERCGNCPIGAAGLERFSSLYPERFIGIAVHCTKSFSTGVMESPYYATMFVNSPRFPITSLPTAVLNRKEAVSPTDIPQIDAAVKSLLKERSVAKGKITRVDCDFESGEVEVEYNVTTGVDVTGACLGASVVLLADGLVGSSPAWMQHNYYSGQPRPEYIDDSWWEYVKFYYEYPSSLISTTDKAFNHVAMGIYPDFNGKRSGLPEDWIKGQEYSSKINFTMPLQQQINEFGVQDTHNTAVALLIFDRRTGEIIGADRVTAENYNHDLSAVESVPTDCGPADSDAFYSLDGFRINPTTCAPGIYIRRSAYGTSKILIKR